MVHPTLRLSWTTGLETQHVCYFIQSQYGHERSFCEQEGPSLLYLMYFFNLGAGVAGLMAAFLHTFPDAMCWEAVLMAQS